MMTAKQDRQAAVGSLGSFWLCLFSGKMGGCSPTAWISISSENCHLASFHLPAVPSDRQWVCGCP